MNFLELVLLSNIMIWFIITYIIYKKMNDALHYGIIFSLLFILTYPLKLYITIAYGIKVIDVSEVSINDYWLTVIISNMGAFLFILPIFVFRKNITRFHENKKLTNKKSMLLLLLLFTLTIIFFSYGTGAIKAVFSFSELEMANRIQERRAERVGSGLSAILRSMGITLLFIYIINISDKFLYYSKKRKIILISILVVTSYLLLAVSGSKYLALLPWIIFLLCYNRLMLIKTNSGISLHSLVYFGAFSVFAIGLLGYIRGFGTIVSEYGYSKIYLGFRQLTNAFDAGDNLSVILHRMNDIWFGEIAFHTTIDYITSWIPRFIWYDKPLVRGNQYIMQYILPERFDGHMGEAISSSLHGQLLLDGGILYMAIAIFMTGLLYWLLYFYFITKNNLYTNIIYMWFTINIFGLLRSGFGIYSGFINFLLGMILIYFFYEILTSKKKKRNI